ncbi:TPA: hypothetical protein QDA93_003353 [Burkholderia vietnamiensis]|nr:hypothetical protein [Burkholderia vietnamiensis]
MNTKETDQTLEQLKSIAGSLETLSALRLFETFYPAEERQNLIARHRQLYDEDAAAFAGLRSAQGAQPDQGLGYDARVEKHGEEAVTQQYAPVHAALEKRRETLKAIDQFEAAHPLIKQLSGYAPGVVPATPKS